MSSTQTTAEPRERARGRLAGRRTLITGAGSGMGRTAAVRFAAEGARVAVADLDGDAAEETRAAIGEDGVALQADVSQPDSVARMVRGAADAFGGIDVLFSNAGVSQPATPFAETSLESWERIVAVNMTAFFLCARAALPVMGAGGSMIVTASVAANRPRAGIAAYVASKSGVIGLARCLALELAPAGIRVNVINPGPARTPMLREFRFGSDEAETAARVEASVPLGCLIEPGDIAAAALYLASDDAAKVTGLVLNVDGGRDL